jgi:hypothetical protein
VKCEVPDQGLFVKRLYAQTQVIDIPGPGARGIPAPLAETAINGDKIDHCTSGAQMDEAEVIPPLNHPAPEHVAVEGNGSIQVGHPENDVI